MIIFKRCIQKVDGSLSIDPNDPLFNKFSANFFILEKTISKENIPENTEIKIILLSDGRVTAILPDGREFSHI